MLPEIEPKVEVNFFQQFDYLIFSTETKRIAVHCSLISEKSESWQVNHN